MSAGISLRKVSIEWENAYFAYDNSEDRIASPLFRSPREMAEYAVAHSKTFTDIDNVRKRLDDWLYEAENIQVGLSISRENFLKIMTMLHVMKSGESLNMEEACLFQEFIEFMEGVVDLNQEHPEISSEQVDTWIDTLQMREDYKETYDSQDILDSTKNKSVWELYWNKTRNPENFNNPKEILSGATKNENILAGLYYEAIIKIAISKLTKDNILVDISSEAWAILIQN